MKEPQSTELTVRQLQRRIDAWMSQFEEGYWPPLANVARLAEEVGELAREVNHRYGPKKRKASEAEGSIAQELGDIVFTVVAIANSLEIDLDEALEQTLHKVETRDANRWKRRDGEG